MLWLLVILPSTNSLLGAYISSGVILQWHKTVQVGNVTVADDFTIHEFFIGCLYFFRCCPTIAQNRSGRKCYGCWWFYHPRILYWAPIFLLVLSYNRTIVLQSHKTVQVGNLMVADDFTILEFFIGHLYFFWCCPTTTQNSSGNKFLMIDCDFAIREFFIGCLCFFWCHPTTAQCNSSGRKIYDFTIHEFLLGSYIPSGVVLQPHTTFW